jgi:hypothetical protein
MSFEECFAHFFCGTLARTCLASVVLHEHEVFMRERLSCVAAAMRAA